MSTVMLTVKELQEILKMSRTKTYQIVNQPDFPKIRIGREIRIPENELESYLKEQIEKDVPLFGTFLDGENMYTKELTNNGIIVMGNEGKGIRPQIEQLINQKLYIPSFPADRETSESLNVAIATAVICAEFRRRQGNR